MSAPTFAIPLTGLRATPIASYLSALAVFAVASDRWPCTTALWHGDQLRLQGSFTHSELVHHLVSDYAPSPVASPWNAGSGFYGEDQDAILAIEASRERRLRDYREMVAVIRRHVPSQPPLGTAKTQLMQALRRDYEPRARRWLDATVDLTRDPPRYHDLLFTGGNDGKLDFARNTLEAVADLMVRKQPPDAERLLKAYLDEGDDVALPSQSLGAFDPSTAKGLDYGILPRSNPWAQILLVEGLLNLDGLAQHRPYLPAGQASLVPRETAKKDFWLPLWRQPATLQQLRRDPDLITGHWRYATLLRNGRAHFIVPIAYRGADETLPNPRELVRAHDGSDEFELALCLAGLGAGLDLHPNLHLAPQLVHLKGTQGMTRLLRSRVRAANQIQKRPNRVGIRRFNDPFWSARPASATLIARYLDGAIDTTRLHRLVRALCPLSISPNLQEHAMTLLPYPYRLLKLAFSQHQGDRRPAPLEVLTSLARADLSTALAQAHRFLLHRHPHLPQPVADRGPQMANLANALLIPISSGTYQAFLESLS